MTTYLTDADAVSSFARDLSIMTTAWRSIHGGARITPQGDMALLSFGLNIDDRPGYVSAETKTSISGLHWIDLRYRDLSRPTDSDLSFQEPIDSARSSTRHVIGEAFASLARWTKRGDQTSFHYADYAAANDRDADLLADIAASLHGAQRFVVYRPDQLKSRVVARSTGQVLNAPEIETISRHLDHLRPNDCYIHKSSSSGVELWSVVEQPRRHAEGTPIDPISLLRVIKEASVQAA